MSAPREFNMNFNFKIVYTCIVDNIEISSHATLHDLFDEVSAKFKPYINYNKYYLDFVVAGQDKDELASVVGHHNLSELLWYEFGERWRQISFYVRPINRNDELFHRMDNYNVEPIEEEVTEVESRERDTLGVNLPPPPELTRQVDREIFV